MICLCADAPSIISDPSGVVEVKIGTIFEIVCEARGIPHPIITWRQQGKSSSDHLDNTRRRIIEVKDREMAGPIECIATNGVGEAAAGINLVVLCKCEAIFPANTPNYHSANPLQLHRKSEPATALSIQKYRCVPIWSVR